MPTSHQAWHVYFCPRCENAYPDPKDKLVVAAYVSEKTILGIFINTKSSDWLRKKSLERCEASILAAEHSILQYDSFVDCQTVYEFNDFELTQDKGEISKQAKLMILQAIQDCPIIERRLKRLILEAEGIPYEPPSLS